MDPQKLTEKLQQYAALAAAFYLLAGQLGDGFKKVLELAKPDHGLNDEEINAIEQATIADAEKREAEREAMAKQGDSSAPDATGQP